MYKTFNFSAKNRNQLWARMRAKNMISSQHSLSQSHSFAHSHLQYLIYFDFSSPRGSFTNEVEVFFFCAHTTKKPNHSTRFAVFCMFVSVGKFTHSICHIYSVCLCRQIYIIYAYVDKIFFGTYLLIIVRYLLRDASQAEKKHM